MLISHALSAYFNGRLVSHLGMAAMLRFGWSIMSLSGIFMVLGYVIFGMNVWVIMLPIVWFYFGATFIWPNAFAIAFTPFGAIAGYAGALYGFMQICGAAVFAGMISYLPDHNQVPLAIVMIVIPVIAWIIFEKKVVR